MADNIDMVARGRFADAVDRLMTVDVPGRGFVPLAYDIARHKCDRSLTQDAGERLLAAMSETQAPVVFIVTGATSQRIGLSEWIGEMDGPPGAIALARTLALTHRAVPVLLTDPGQGKMLSEAARSLGLYSLPVADVRRQAHATTHTTSIAVIEIPADAAAAADQAKSLLADLGPRAAIAIEKAGENECGVFHNSQKADTSAGKARVDALFRACAGAGVLTIGIGDGGNEIGMGSIKDDLLKVFPHMAVCNCPCKGSILADRATDCLIVATVSNWGAYALAAYVALASGQPYACHTPNREARLLDGAARAGYMHMDGFCLPGADGMPEEVHTAFVRMLSTMVHWPPLKHGRAGYLKDMLPP